MTAPPLHALAPFSLPSAGSRTFKGKLQGMFQGVSAKGSEDRLIFLVFLVYFLAKIFCRKSAKAPLEIWEEDRGCN